MLLVGINEALTVHKYEDIYVGYCLFFYAGRRFH